jgi:putative oxidoreductase
VRTLVLAPRRQTLAQAGGVCCPAEQTEGEQKMTVALWVVQVLLAAVFLPAGVLHGFHYERARAQLQWPAAVPRGVMTFIGVSEILGAVGLILPAVTRNLPWLTPLAALGLASIMVLAIGFHFTRREYPNSAFNAVLLVLTAFVAYGRFAVAPL